MNEWNEQGTRLGDKKKKWDCSCLPVSYTPIHVPIHDERGMRYEPRELQSADKIKDGCERDVSSSQKKN